MTWLSSPSRSFGSNHVDLGGMVSPASEILIKSATSTGNIENATAAAPLPTVRDPDQTVQSHQPGDALAADVNAEPEAQLGEHARSTISLAGVGVDASDRGFFAHAALALVLLTIALPSQAAVRVLATTADWGALVKELGGDRVDVYVATTAMQDVHHVEAKPSLVARARTADLLVANGAELEAGWLPVLLQESGNPRIQRGAPGFFDAASTVALLEVPTKLDRAMGDIHPLGNPHIHLDPRNVAAVARALTAKLTAVDPAGAEAYAARGADFG